MGGRKENKEVILKHVIVIPKCNLRYLRQHSNKQKPFHEIFLSSKEKVQMEKEHLSEEQIIMLEEMLHRDLGFILHRQ